MFEDLNLSIPLGKELENAPQHPTSNFTSFDKLSSQHQAFINQLNLIEIPSTVQEALRNEN